VEFWPLKTGQAARFSTGGTSFPQQRLNFWPDLQGQGAFRGVFRIGVAVVGAGLQFEAIDHWLLVCDLASTDEAIIVGVGPDPNPRDRLVR
jgi:hypothetical protein